MVLVILAGITLNAVIGEDGIIFQAKDTKNMITNETEYDEQQLAGLQNELKDNELYSGIGIIPGTDTGGSSEGGENGSSGGGNQGGSNSGGTNTNTGGSDGSMIGGDAVPPTITVLEGEEIAASFFRSDVTIQIATTDKTLRIKYILTTTVDEINNELYPSGLIKEIDIENGGTLTFTKDGEYTITAYSYDLEGKKSNSSIMWLKRETGSTAGNGVTVSVASGNMGQNEWYTSNITLRVLGTDTGSARVTYRVRGTAYGSGTIGNTEYQAGEVDTGEVEIANGTTFRIAIDGNFAIVAYTYDSGGMRLSTAPTLNVRRDASRPIVTLYKGEQIIGEGFRISMAAEDYASGLATSGRYTYRHKLAPNMTYTDNLSQETTYLYTGLEADKTYDMYMIVKDEAGNMTASDVISRPAIWVSNNATAGDKGTEGAREYYQSDVDVSLTGQDENNVDISRVTYQILGTTTGAGNMDGTYYDRGVSLPEDEIEMANEKTIPIRADGNWTIKIHTYNKENVRVTTNTLEVTRDMVNPTANIAPEITVGTMGEATYYRSDVTIRISGGLDDTSYKEMGYVVTGIAKGNGKIGNVNVTTNQSVNTGEVKINKDGTFVISADGTWTVTAYAYDKAGRKSAASTGLVFTRDTVGPTISSITKTGIGATTLSVSVSASDGTSGLASSGTYQYYLNNASKATQTGNTYTYRGINYTSKPSSFSAKVVVKDKAGNTSEKTQSIAITYTLKKDCAYTGGQQSYSIPKTGAYILEAYGASGSGGNTNNNSYSASGGKGAKITGSFSLNSGDTLQIIVGGQGRTTQAGTKDGTSGGGGGGSFIFRQISSITDSRYQFTKGSINYEALLVAAGGSGSEDAGFRQSNSTGYAGQGAKYYSPNNYKAYSKTTQDPNSSSSTGSPLGISQFISYNLSGGKYTRGNGVSQGGYGRRRK